MLFLAKWFIYHFIYLFIFSYAHNQLQQGQPVEMFSAFRSLQVEALHANAQLIFEINIEDDDSDKQLASIKTCYERAESIIAVLKDKYKTPSITNLLLRYIFIMLQWKQGSNIS